MRYVRSAVESIQGETELSFSLCVDREAARRCVLQAQREGKKVGLVPTMGALHPGHLSLVEASRSTCDVTVVSVFVNPTQFGPNEDFDKYPRDLDRDRELLERAGANLVFAPNANDMYRPNHSTYIQPPRVAQRWEGEMRPDHFRGVATIVLKLLQIVPADIALFGQKDFQQVRVIQDMCVDLDLPVSIQICPTIREPDGLALSSRNAYLSASERRRALSLSQALRVAGEMFRAGNVAAEDVRAKIRELLTAAPVDHIDYVAIADPRTLEPVEQIVPDTMALIAAHIGGTRLIDNAVLGQDS